MSVLSLIKLVREADVDATVELCGDSLIELTDPWADCCWIGRRVVDDAGFFGDTSGLTASDCANGFETCVWGVATFDFATYGLRRLVRITPIYKTMKERQKQTLR